MKELTVDNISAAYKKALQEMKEPYRKVTRAQLPALKAASEPQFVLPPPKLPRISEVWPGIMRNNNAL